MEISAKASVTLWSFFPYAETLKLEPPPGYSNVFFSSSRQTKPRAKGVWFYTETQSEKNMNRGQNAHTHTEDKKERKKKKTKIPKE
jgi:hypothetical protein